MFNSIISLQSYEQLKLVFDEYAAITNHTIEQAINSEFSGDIQAGLLTIGKTTSFIFCRETPSIFGHEIGRKFLLSTAVVNISFVLISVKCVNNKPAYFAEKLYSAMKVTRHLGSQLLIAIPSSMLQ